MRGIELTDQEAVEEQRVDQWVDSHLTPVTTTPRGRKGLWGALADTVCPSIAERALPTIDVSRLGVSPNMFDYDPDLATALWVD